MFLSHLYVRKLLYKCDYKYWDILDNQDNFVVNTEIWFWALSHTPNWHYICWACVVGTINNTEEDSFKNYVYVWLEGCHAGYMTKKVAIHVVTIYQET